MAIIIRAACSNQTTDHPEQLNHSFTMSAYVSKLSALAAGRKKKHTDSNGPKISHEELVKTLMKLKEKVIAPNTKGIDTTYQIRYCPKKSLCKNLKAEVKFQDKSGWSAPYSHMLACCFSGNEDQALDEYWEAKSVMKQLQQSQLTIGTAMSPPTLSSPPNIYNILQQREKDMHAWIHMIVMKGLPFSCVADEDFRAFAKSITRFGISTLRKVILAMTVIVEDVLADEMAAAFQGSIVHDAWSKFGEHFFALFATYKATRMSLVDGVVVERTSPVISLLSVAPLHTPTREVIDSDGFMPTAEEAEMEEASEYTAQVHADHIQHILQDFYGINVSWITNQTADSASVNLKLAKLLDIPHVNCENHLLNNEVKRWQLGSTAEDINPLSRSFQAGSVMKMIHQTMISCKTNKNRARLRSTGTMLAPTLACDTRWSSSFNMMRKYEKLNDCIVSASLEENSDIVLPPTSHAFTKAVKKTTLVLNDINNVALKMQGHMATLEQCGSYQQVLITLSDGSRHDPESPWHNNTFGKEYIDPESAKRPDKVFVSAVKKMQRRQASTLTAEETDVIKKWMPKPIASVHQISGGTPVSAADLLSQLPISGGKKLSGAKRGSNEISTGGSDDCFDHVIGSAAEVERLWSIARYILTTSRTRLEPIIFEALLFLRANRVLWDERTVQAAIHAAQKDDKDERLAKKLKEAEDQAED